MPETDSILLRVDGLSKSFDGVRVVDDISFDVRRGEILAILGPSGCGKTTTLRAIAGFAPPESGTISLAGRILAEEGCNRVRTEKRGIGVVFQDYALFPHLTVGENVAFGLARTVDRGSRVREMLELVDLGGLADRMPYALSGGQQQRVALARTLAPRPDLVLLDEPFSGLDAAMRETTRHDVRSLLKKAGQTAILVTHDQEEALSVADRIAVMVSGRIEQIGDAESIYRTPRTIFVAQFLGRTNLLLSEASGETADTPIGPVRLDRPASGPVLVSLRPEDIDLVEAGADLPEGRIVSRAFRGHDITFTVAIGNGEYLVHTPARVGFEPGDRVGLAATQPAVVLEKGTVR